MNLILREVAEKYQEMHVLKPLKGWSATNTAFIASSGNTYGADGVAVIWWAINHAIKYFDMHKNNPLHLNGYKQYKTNNDNFTSNGPLTQKKFKCDTYHKFHWNHHSKY